MGVDLFNCRRGAGGGERQQGSPEAEALRHRAVRSSGPVGAQVARRRTNGGGGPAREPAQ